MSTLAD